MYGLRDPWQRSEMARPKRQPSPNERDERESVKSSARAQGREEKGDGLDPRFVEQRKAERHRWSSFRRLGTSQCGPRARAAARRKEHRELRIATRGLFRRFGRSSRPCATLRQYPREAPTSKRAELRTLSAAECFALAATPICRPGSDTRASNPSRRERWIQPSARSVRGTADSLRIALAAPRLLQKKFSD